MDPMAMLEAIRETMSDPQMKHAATVHLPIALSMLGVLLVLLAAFLGGRSRAMAWTAFGAYVLLIFIARFAVNTGEDTQNDLNVAYAQINELVNEHEEMAEKVWMFALAVSVVLLVGALTKARVRIASAVIALILSLVTALWIGTTAHHGGTLVYAYGAGTPVPVAVPIGEAAVDGNDQSAGDDEDGEPEPVDDPRLAHFREYIKPVLETQCIKCHNPARKRRSAELDQTTMTGMLEGGMSGPAVVPGNPDASWLIMAIRYEEDLEMPPKKDKLSDEIIAAFEKWVKDGAVWETLAPPPPRQEKPATPEAPPAGDDAAGDTSG